MKYAALKRLGKSWLSSLPPISESKVAVTSQWNVRVRRVQNLELLNNGVDKNNSFISL